MVEASSMSVVSLISNATIVVQLVMVLLIVASLTSWYMIVSRFRVMGRAHKAGRAFEEKFWSSDDLASLYNQSRKDPDVDAGPESIFRAGFQEFVRLSKSTRGAEAVMDGSQRAMRVALQREQTRLTKHLPFLATVGSTSPYVGLFGTVWGIMNSFIGIAEQQTTNLAVVAPGIAEALLATALGLVAAIPAVVIYNHFARAIAAHRAVVADSAAALLRIISRDLSRGTLDAGSV
mgnify:CR=1 FL=1